MVEKICRTCLMQQEGCVPWNPPCSVCKLVDGDRTEWRPIPTSRSMGFYPLCTLRDWFAGQALGSVVMATAQGFNRPEPKFDGEKVSSVLAREAYALADAMLAEREKTNAEP